MKHRQKNFYHSKKKEEKDTFPKLHKPLVSKQKQADVKEVIVLEKKVKTRKDISYSFYLSAAIFFVLSIFVLIFPGQNYYQTLNPSVQKPSVRDISLNISLNDYPKVLGLISPPILTAESTLAIDVATNVVLYEKSPNTQLKPASTTKIMTAIVAQDLFNPKDVLEVKSDFKEGAQMGLQKGDLLTFENLLKGLLINSGNDAALAVAENYPGGIEQFIYSMNKKASKLNMNNTHFNNINGFDEPNHYTTSLDLARLAVYALKNPEFAKIVSTQNDDISDISGKRWYRLSNVNKLLGQVYGINGVKTGFTEEAGECLITSVKRESRQILIVILKSKDRFGETAALIDWLYKSTTWEKEQS